MTFQVWFYQQNVIKDSKIQILGSTIR
jgi:hypothetical protein